MAEDMTTGDLTASGAAPHLSVKVGIDKVGSRAGAFSKFSVSAVTPAARNPPTPKTVLGMAG